MFDLKYILGGQVQKKGVAKSMEASVVCDKFDKWAADKFKSEFSELSDLGNLVKAEKFVNGVLTIKTKSSVIAQEIKLNEPQIREEINGMLGERVIKNLAFRS